MLKYPPKILIAFGEAAAGNKKILKWLIDNSYPELAAVADCIQSRCKKCGKEAFDWLIKYNYHQYAALCDSIRGNEDAYSWLKKNKFDFLIIIIDAFFEEKEAIDWLRKEDLDIFVIITQKIKMFLQKKRNDKGDYHKFTFWS
jgi:hypothetical protein